MEQQNSESQTPPADPTPSIKNSSSLKSKWPLLVIGLLVLIILPLGGYFLMNENSKTQPAPSPTPTTSPTVEPSTTLAPSAIPAALKSFTSPKFSELGFKGYSLNYPTDWTLSEERDNSVPISTVTITKQGYSLKIFQAATGGAGCVYEGDMPEGPASDYRNNIYKDLVTGFGTLRQTEAPSNSKMAYSYCQKSTSDGSYGQPTSVGHMNATTSVASPDLNIITELEEIVKSIKTL